MLYSSDFQVFYNDYNYRLLMCYIHCYVSCYELVLFHTGLWCNVSYYLVWQIFKKETSRNSSCCCSTSSDSRQLFQIPFVSSNVLLYTHAFATGFFRHVQHVCILLEIIFSICHILPWSVQFIHVFAQNRYSYLVPTVSVRPHVTCI